MPKNAKNTKNMSLASEIIADQEAKVEKLGVAVVALSVVLLTTAVTKGKKK